MTQWAGASDMAKDAVIVWAVGLAPAGGQEVGGSSISMGQVDSLLMLDCLAELFRPGAGGWPS